MTSTGSLLSGLDCRACCTQVRPDRPVGTCPTCGGALLAQYDLSRLDAQGWCDHLEQRPRTLWRYRELLPVQAVESVVTLGEGYTPILPLDSVEAAEGVEVMMKDDGVLPTGSFKARGMAVAVSRVRELGVQETFVPSAGNAGVALAAYSARAGLAARVYLPESTPATARSACLAFGAEVVTAPGTIADVGDAARTRERGRGSFDLSTLREPYRVEGKKTMGFEIFEQLRREGLPDAIVYPAGGGTGLVGMFKAFDELRSVGLLDRMPRLIAVQPEGCAPLVRALGEGATRARPWPEPHTAAAGLLVAAPFASERILEAIRESRGCGVTVTDPELRSAAARLSLGHGVSAGLEGSAPFAALPKLVEARKVVPGERILLYNTGAGHLSAES